MRLLNPYAKQPTFKSVTEPMVEPKEPVETIAKPIVEPVVEKQETVDIELEKSIFVPQNEPDHDYKVVDYSRKSFDHLHSQELIDKTRELKKRLFPIDFSIPKEFQDLQNCLNANGDCSYEVHTIMSK